LLAVGERRCRPEPSGYYGGTTRNPCIPQCKMRFGDPNKIEKLTH
jgi:hypothetical protein